MAPTDHPPRRGSELPTRRAGDPLEVDPGCSPALRQVDQGLRDLIERPAPPGTSVSRHPAQGLPDGWPTSRPFSTVESVTSRLRCQKRDALSFLGFHSPPRSPPPPLRPSPPDWRSPLHRLAAAVLEQAARWRIIRRSFPGIPRAIGSRVRCRCESRVAAGHPDRRSGRHGLRRSLSGGVVREPGGSLTFMRFVTSKNAPRSVSSVGQTS
jgi:hypothetical protein